MDGESRRMIYLLFGMDGAMDQYVFVVYAEWVQNSEGYLINIKPSWAELPKI